LIDNESKILLSTQLKLVKLKSQKFKPSEDATTELKNSHFEFDISTSVASFSSADLSSKNKSKYTVILISLFRERKQLYLDTVFSLTKVPGTSWVLN
jgi:hypothetical protein